MPGTITVRWTATRGCLATWGYARNAASLPKRLTSLAIVIALSGSPAVLSVCMALCQPGVATAASHEGSPPEGHSVHASAPATAVASVYDHHGSSGSNAPAAKATNSASSHEWSDARLTATCRHCCSDAVAFVAGPGAERIDARGFATTPMIPLVASFLVTTSVPGASPPSPPVPPPSPNRAPLALRI